MDSKAVLSKISEMAVAPVSINGVTGIHPQPTIKLGRAAFNAAVEAILEQLQLAHNGGIDTNKLQAVQKEARKNGLIMYEARMVTNAGMVGAAHDGAFHKIKIYLLRDSGRDAWYAERHR